MLFVEATKQFKKDWNLAKRRGKKLELLEAVMEQIECEKLLSKSLKDHQLTGNWDSHRELHIQNDWLLIYRLIPDKKTVVFVRTGSHADLFR